MDHEHPDTVCDPSHEDQVLDVFHDCLARYPLATETELQFFAAAAFERQSLKTLMELLCEGRLEVRLRPGGSIALVNDYEWRVVDAEEETHGIAE
jgi:hypothetical protein